MLRKKYLMNKAFKELENLLNFYNGLNNKRGRKIYLKINEVNNQYDKLQNKIDLYL